MLGVYNYTVIMTYLGLLSSYAGMHFAIRGNFRAAILCLMVSGFFDMFDGKVASTKKNRSEAEKLFGIQIDSMSDIVCYGVFPALFVCQLNGYQPLSKIVGGFYLLCAVIRLCYFNVDEEARQRDSNGKDRTEYDGLPVTSIAIILPFVFALGKIFFYDAAEAYFNNRMEIFSCGTIAFCAMCFITPFKLPKPKLLGKILMILVALAEFIFLCIVK